MLNIMILYVPFYEFFHVLLLERIRKFSVLCCIVRTLHHRSLYSYIHKRHHEWTAPIGIISLYAHPIEHLVSNLLPPVLGPLLMGSHLCSAWVWFSIALLSTTVAHCGYHFPLLPSPEAHDYHHKT